MPALLMRRTGRCLAAAALPGLLWCATAAAELPVEAELSVSGLTLDDAANAKAPFGMPPQLDDPDSDHPKAYFCNHDRSERLALIYNEGDTAYIIGEFRVESVETRYSDCVQPAAPLQRFVTGKGIQLGMRRDEVTRILGPGYTEHAQLDENVIIYRIDDKGASGFLQSHHAPAYYGQYHFRQERLIRFGFGFEFP